MGLSFHVYKVVKFRKLRRRGEIVLKASSDNAEEDDGDDVDVGDGDGGGVVKNNRTDLVGLLLPSAFLI